MIDSLVYSKGAQIGKVDDVDYRQRAFYVIQKA